MHQKLLKFKENNCKNLNILTILTLSFSMYSLYSKRLLYFSILTFSVQQKYLCHGR